MQNYVLVFYKWCRENWLSTYKRQRMDVYLPPCKKINSKYIFSLNIKSEILKLLEENIDSTFQDIGAKRDFLSRSLFPQELMPKINEWDSIN